jgi:hypothetical protein
MESDKLAALNERHFIKSEPAQSSGLYPFRADDWIYKSDAEKRCWALQQIGLHDIGRRYGEETPLSELEMFARADVLVNYITHGRRAAGSQSPSDGSPSQQHSEGARAQQLPEAI